MAFIRVLVNNELVAFFQSDVIPNVGERFTIRQEIYTVDNRFFLYEENHDGEISTSCDITATRE
jgi:hypothetical protein